MRSGPPAPERPDLPGAFSEGGPGRSSGPGPKALQRLADQGRLPGGDPLEGFGRVEVGDAVDLRVASHASGALRLFDLEAVADEALEVEVGPDYPGYLTGRGRIEALNLRKLL